MSGIKSKPRGFSCYLCGAQFGSLSLLIHVKSCQKKWVKQNEQQPPGKRRPLPPPPPELADPGDPSSLASSTDALLLPSKPEDIDAFNARMFSYWDQVSLEGCPHCGRTFNQEALDKHKKVCSAQKPFKPLHKSSSEGAGGAGDGSGRVTFPGSSSPAGAPGKSEAPSSSGPRSYTCFLCGRGFMSRSLGIHLPQCLIKWKADESRRPIGQQRKPPSPPEELADPSSPTKLRQFKDGVAEGILPGSPADIEAFNARMAAAYQNSSLAACDGCGRTFNWESLERHKKGCSGKQAGKGQGKSPPKLTVPDATSSPKASSPGSDSGRDNSPGPKTFTCYLCGRGYMSRSLGIHLPQCLAKWISDEEQRPPTQRRPPPRPPTELADPADPTCIRPFRDGMDEGILPKKREEIDAFNRRMATYWDRASLCPCENCGRTFSREALERHRVLCTPDNPMKSVPGSNKPPQTTTAQPADEKSKSTLSASSGPASPSSPLDRGSRGPAGPRTYTCFLCGRGFMNRSLGIHLPQCLTKWEAEEARRHPDVQRTSPVPPEELADPTDPSKLLCFRDGVSEGVLPKSPNGIEAFNKRMTEVYERCSLVGCPNCGRTFHWEGLGSHEKLCTPSNPMKRTTARK